MGFGRKTDYATGRVLDLDKTYKYLIKPIAEKNGLMTVRADELIHSGTIDVPMYNYLLTADVVIADISTANPNAIYELGVRHALRPQATIIIAEQELAYPFDLSHISILRYKHLGDSIDIEEAERFKKTLEEKLLAVLSSKEIDSPVYTHLSGLSPPSHRTPSFDAGLGTHFSVPSAETGPSLAELMAEGTELFDKMNYSGAKKKFHAAQQLIHHQDPNFSYVTQ